jgi:hypothetical protein
MLNDREVISVALFDLLANNAGIQELFVTTSRAAKMFTEVDASLQPALYLMKVGEQTVQNEAYGLTKYILEYRILAYARADATPETIYETLLNQMLDAVDAAMQSTPPGENQTLGGVVTNAWIEGATDVDTGVLQQQCALVIPIKVITGI